MAIMVIFGANFCFFFQSNENYDFGTLKRFL
jgi:hypothetical protein